MIKSWNQLLWSQLTFDPRAKQEAGRIYFLNVFYSDCGLVINGSNIHPVIGLLGSCHLIMCSCFLCVPVLLPGCCKQKAKCARGHLSRTEDTTHFSSTDVLIRVASKNTVGFLHLVPHRRSSGHSSSKRRSRRRTTGGSEPLQQDLLLRPLWSTLARHPGTDGRSHVLFK